MFLKDFYIVDIFFSLILRPLHRICYVNLSHGSFFLHLVPTITLEPMMVCIIVFEGGREDTHTKISY